MKKTLLSLLLGVSCIGTAQITTSSSYTTGQLVNDVLISTPASITVSNISSSTGIDFGSVNGLGYFNQNGSSFPLEEGIILSTGSITTAPGPNTETNSGGDANWPGDADLYDFFGGNSPTLNATVLEFDFVANGTILSLDYIFAAEEYGAYQCSNSDSFAILITDLNTGALYNIAGIPDTTIPVSVTTVRDSQYNSNCPSVNAEYFGDYYTAGNTAAPVNFNGTTVPFHIETEIQAGVEYNIKFVIADRGDSTLDSALFIGGLQVNEGVVDIGSPNDLFGCAPLSGDQIVEFNLTQNTNLILNGLSPEEYTVSYYEGYDASVQPIQNPEAYNMMTDWQHITAKVTENANPENFSITGFDIYVAPKPDAGEAQGLGAIDDNNDGTAIFNLTLTQDQIFNGQPADLLSVQYYLTIQDQLGETAAIADPTQFEGTNQTIYFALTYDNSWCKSYGSFEIVVLPSDYETPAPSGDSVQTFTEGETLANLEVEGENVQWYVSQNLEAGRSDDTPLPLSTPLEDGTTYYASQTVYGIESTERLPVTVNAVLGVEDNVFEGLKVYPNPVNDILAISSDEKIENISVYNQLGQRVISSNINSRNAQVNVSALSNGIYIAKIISAGKEKTFKVVKQ